jgi:hypothetical protein
MNDETQSDDSSPVVLELTKPVAYDRTQLLLRLVLCIAIGLFHLSFGGLLIAIYLLLPAAAAILISREEGPGLSASDSARMEAFLGWFIAFYAYMLLATDRFPVNAQRPQPALRIVCSGKPSSSDAMLRLLWGLPHALVFIVMAVAASIVAFLIAVCVLFGTPVPATLHKFQCDMLSWMAWFFAYHASLVDVAPTFARRVPPAHSAQ